MIPTQDVSWTDIESLIEYVKKHRCLKGYANEINSKNNLKAILKIKTIIG